MLASCAILIGGCQSTSSSSGVKAINNAHLSMRGASLIAKDYPQKISANTQNYQNLFDETANPNPDSLAHQRLLKAMHSHLTQDHVAVTQLNHHAVPYVKEGSVDALSDSLLRTLFQTFAKRLDGDHSQLDDYDTDDSSDEAVEPAFREEEDYLSQPHELYLNYRDELAGSVPEAGYDIDRQTGMSEPFVETTDRSIEYVDTLNDCLVNYSYEVDELISGDPTLKANDPKLKPFKKTYDECVAQSQKSYADIIKAAVGYQRQYLNQQTTCMKQFDGRLADLLNPTRSPQQINYDHYDSIYQNYDVCYSAVINRYKMEPSFYTYVELGQASLDYKNGLVDCANDLAKQQQTLAQTGITYRNNPKAYANLYYDYESCDAEAYNQAYYSSHNSSSELEINDAFEEEPVDSTDEIGEDTNDVAAEEWVADGVVSEDDSYDNGYGDDESYENEGYENESDESDSDDDEYEYGSEREYSGVINKLLNWLKRTPEQIQAANLYNYQYLTLNSVSRYEASNKRISSIYSYDFASPTMLSSVQIPIAVDFNNAQMSVDPSAIMPVVALLSPEHAPLPEDMTSTTVSFNMPESMTSQLPPAVVYDIFIEAIETGMSELDSSYFTALDISDDGFAKQLGAQRAVKVNLGSKQSGELVGAIIKHMAQSLKAYVDEHPDQISDASALRASIDKWQHYNEKFQTQDAGSILQLIEAIGPISFNKINTYYLDANDKLIGKQIRTMMGGNITGSKSTFLSQTRYDDASFNRHPLAPLFKESFGQRAKAPMDGNQWIAQIKDRRAKLEQARYARYDYEREDSDDYYQSDDDKPSPSDIFDNTESAESAENTKVTESTEDAKDTSAVQLGDDMEYSDNVLTDVSIDDEAYRISEEQKY